ncbi:MAG: hypothetical protein ABH950_08885 [Candidatus Altiarchaeota archaeon]
MINIKNMIKPALIAGGVMGFIGSIPVINFLNFLCCLLVIVGGAGAAYLLKKKNPRLELVDGAVVGALSGVSYAVVATVFGTIISLAITAIFGAAFMPFAMMDNGFAGPMGNMGMSAVGTMIGAVFGLILGLIINPVFGAIGGVIYVKVTEGKRSGGVPTNAKNVTPDSSSDNPTPDDVIRGRD